MKTIPHYSKTIDYKVLDRIELQVKVTDTSEDILPNKLFEVAARKNKKRAFLFVSKILGKHLAIDPKIPLLGGKALGACYYEKTTDKAGDLKSILSLLASEPINAIAYEQVMAPRYELLEETLFIGFAETATGLGHAMFASFSGKASYIHTTREAIISESPVFCFEEEHSHATAHRCFSEKKDFFKGFKHIVLVDDEITTGNTALNLIQALNAFCGVKSYRVASLLDWRDKAQQARVKALEKALGLNIEFISLVQGEIEVKVLKEVTKELLETQSLIKPLNKEQQPAKPLWQCHQLAFSFLGEKQTKGGDEQLRSLSYIKETGRFGINALSNEAAVSQKEAVKAMGEQLKQYRSEETCLCIGTEEFMFLPFLIASYMGEGVTYQSSTRSPIITQKETGYPIWDAIAYKRPEDESVTNYLYNIEKTHCTEAFWFFERAVSTEFMDKLEAAFRQRGIKKLHFVFCDGIVFTH